MFSNFYQKSFMLKNTNQIDQYKRQNQMQRIFPQREQNDQIDISEYLFNRVSHSEEILVTSVPNQIQSINQNSFPTINYHQNSLESTRVSSLKPNPIQISLINQNLKISDEAYNYYQSESDDEKSPSINKKLSSKNSIYAKKYRNKQKLKMKTLEEQNRFLNSKIDDLSFRLKQTQLELNKLKHSQLQKTHNFHIARQQILKEIQKILQQQEHVDLEILQEVQKKMKELNTFKNSHKMELLNYFMNQLLQNLINDFGLYFVDSLTQKSGYWKNFNICQATKIDIEIAKLLGEQNFKLVKESIQQFPQLAVNHIKNFKRLWKKLYQDYVNIINQGIMIETLCQTLQQKKARQNYQTQVLNYFKLQVYFEKIKYRKDMRKLRESWFNSISLQEQQPRTNRLKMPCRKIKATF